MGSVVKSAKKRSKYVKPCTRCKKGAVNKWGPDGPVCKPCWEELGCPTKPRPAEPELDAGVPEELAAIRAANRWSWEELPKHPLVETWVTIRRKHPKEFKSTLERLEKEYAESSKPVVSSSAAVVEERVEDAVSERVIAECEAWLEKRRVEAEEKARAIERGE